MLHFVLMGSIPNKLMHGMEIFVKLLVGMIEKNLSFLTQFNDMLSIVAVVTSVVVVIVATKKLTELLFITGFPIC